MKLLLQLCRETGISKNTFYTAIKAGRLNAQKIGRDWFVETDEKYNNFFDQYRPRTKKGSDQDDPSLAR